MPVTSGGEAVGYMCPEPELEIPDGPVRESVRFGRRKDWVVLAQTGGRKVEVLWLNGAEVPEVVKEMRREVELMSWVGLMEDVELIKAFDVENP